jgi:type I restriction enzyme S subunit
MSELPQGWVETVIGELTQIETGSTPPTTQAEYYGGEIPFFKPGDLEQGRELVSAENTLSEVGSQVARIIPSRSLLVTCIGNLGKSGLTTKPSSINQQINAILPSDALFPETASARTSGASRCCVQNRNTGVRWPSV